MTALVAYLVSVAAGALVLVLGYALDYRQKHAGEAGGLMTTVTSFVRNTVAARSGRAGARRLGKVGAHHPNLPGAEVLAGRSAVLPPVSRVQGTLSAPSKDGAR